MGEITEGGEGGEVGNSGDRWCSISDHCHRGDSVGGGPVVDVCWVSEGDGDTSDGGGAPAHRPQLDVCSVRVGR